MSKRVFNIEELKDSRILYEKKSPLFGYIIIAIVIFLLISVGIWSVRTPKVYMITSRGVVESENKNYVMSPYSGVITDIYISEGVLVNENDILFKVKCTDINIQITQLKEQKKLYEKIVGQYKKLVRSIKDNTNYFSSTKEEDSLYYSQFEEYKSKVEQSQIDVSTYQAYGYSTEQIEAQLIANEAKITELYYSTINSTERTILEVNNQIASIDAQLNALEEGERECSVRASETGIIHMIKEYKEGMVIQSASTIASISAQMDQYIIVAYVSPQDVVRVKKGNRVNITVNGLTQSIYGTITGTVVSIDSDITESQDSENNSSYFKVYIKPDEKYSNEDITRAISDSIDNVFCEEETMVGVEDIEIFAYKNELYVDETVSITASVLPSNATNTTIRYKSDNKNIATVSSTGEIKGISPGKVRVTLQAENIIKNLDITVKAKTTAIEISEKYIVLKKGETYHLKATVHPDNASQVLSYKSNNADVAKVSENGDIIAKNTGNTTIILSNGDLSNAVTVIVNEVFSSNLQGNSIIVEREGKEDTSEKMLLRKIAEIKDLETKDLENQNSKKQEIDIHNKVSRTIEIKSIDVPVINSNILKALYDHNIQLRISDDEYEVSINGDDIVNSDNILLSSVESEEIGKELYITINDNNPLPGKLTIKVNNDKHYKYLYKYNNSKKKYEQLNVNNTKKIEIDLEGKYLLTNKKIIQHKISIIITTGVCLLTAILLFFYVLLKKKYWFW